MSDVASVRLYEQQQNIAQLQRDNEALRKENDKLKAANARAVIHHIESFCEVCAHCMGEDGCANCINKQLAAAEAKCERLKEAGNKEAFTQEEAEQCEKRMEDIFNESPSASLTNYIREQVKKEIRERTDEVVESLEIAKAHTPQTVSGFGPLSKALAKLKEIRGEK